MLRTAGRAVYRQCRGNGSSQRAAPLSIPFRPFAAEGGGGGGGDRLVELATKDDYINFDREKSVVYFTAKWCPPCRRIGPFLAELSNETPSVAFGKVDIDDNDGAAQMAAIKSVPTFKFFKAGKEIDSMSGADSDLLEENVAKLAEA